MSTLTLESMRKALEILRKNEGAPTPPLEHEGACLVDQQCQHCIMCLKPTQKFLDLINEKGD